jgi:hypothetical protein
MDVFPYRKPFNVETASAEILHCWLTNSEESDEVFAYANAATEIEATANRVFFILIPYFVTTRWTTT